MNTVWDDDNILTSSIMLVMKFLAMGALSALSVSAWRDGSKARVRVKRHVNLHVKLTFY